MRAMLRAAAAACIILFVMPALAADPPTWPRTPEHLTPLVAPEGPRWHRTGFYLGVTAGWDIAQFEAAETFKFSETSLMGGGFIGAQARLQDFVIGIEADYLLMDLKAATTDGSVSLAASTRYLASVRARAGVPIGPALFYVTAGPAFTQHKVTLSDPTLPTPVVEQKDFLTGGVFGAGVEAELSRTLFVRLEGLHYIFPDKDVQFAPGSFFESQNQQTTVRLGIGFKLN